MDKQRPNDGGKIEQATKVARGFVESFYPSLKNSRHSIGSFYAPSSQFEVEPRNFIFNGHKLESGAAMQAFYEQEVPPATFHLHGYDCHPISSDHLGSGKPVLVLVAYGTVSLSGGSGKPGQGAVNFSETFVLAPYPGASSGPGGFSRINQPQTTYLIQSQIFRQVSGFEEEDDA